MINAGVPQGSLIGSLLYLLQFKSWVSSSSSIKSLTTEKGQTILQL